MILHLTIKRSLIYTVLALKRHLNFCEEVKSVVVNVEEIKRTVSDRGLKQRNVALNAGMTENALTLVLASKRKLLADEYVNLCRALCVPYGSFLVDERDSA